MWSVAAKKMQLDYLDYKKKCQKHGGPQACPKVVELSQQIMINYGQCYGETDD